MMEKWKELTTDDPLGEMATTCYLYLSPFKLAVVSP